MRVQPLRCSQCGAGLDDPGDDEVIRCAYCKHVHAVHRAAPAPSATGYAVGQAVLVHWGRSWWDARVVAVQGPALWRIHYDGYGAHYDEDVGPERIRPLDGASPAPAPEMVNRFPVGAAVDVQWRGRWYPARVLRAVGPSAWAIRYEGYGAEWDETVGPDRIVPRGQAAAQPRPQGCGSAAAMMGIAVLGVLAGAVALFALLLWS